LNIVRSASRCRKNTDPFGRRHMSSIGIIAGTIASKIKV
jgi:hypothetical protein